MQKVHAALVAFATTMMGEKIFNLSVAPSEEASIAREDVPRHDCVLRLPRRALHLGGLAPPFLLS